MALGLSTSAGGGGSYLPILKYDARAGRFFRVDRTQDGAGNWQTDNVDVSAGFQAMFGLNDIEVGWINFATGGAPDFQMKPLGQPLGPKPSDGHKQGFRLKVKLGAKIGGDIREFASCAGVVIGAIDQLHTEYEKGAPENRGKLPIVALSTTTAVKSGSGTKTSTNYAPVFGIVKWVDAAPELVGGAPANEPKAEPVQQARATTQAKPVEEPAEDGEEF